MKKRRKIRKKRKKNFIKRFVVDFFLLILLLVGLAMIFNKQIRGLLVDNLAEENAVAKLTPEIIEENKKKKANFDYEAVSSIDMNQILNAKFSSEDFPVIGGIAIPSVNLNLPILNGVDNYTLIVGAGTLKKDQVMGEGNYALAGHHMIQADKLFSPIFRIEMGDPIYLTDLIYIYEYKTVLMKYIKADDIYLRDDVPGKTLVTLITCDDTGAGRYAVQGDFVGKTKLKNTPEHVRQAFNIDINNYEGK